MNGDVLVTWLGGSWDGAEVVRSRSEMRKLLGTLVVCPPLGTAEARIDGLPDFGIKSNSRQLIVYRFDDKFDEEIQLKLRPVIYSSATQPN